MQLLLVRHGETVGNVERRLQGVEDPLTERGKRQAHELAVHLATRGDVRSLYTSPLPRAFETARTIGDAVALAPVPRAALAEVNVGNAAGHQFSEWADRYPEEARHFREGGVDYAWPGGESGLEVAARTAAEIDGIISVHRLERGAVVVVSHGGALAWIIAHLLHEPRDRWPRDHMQLENCSLTEITIDPHYSQAITFVCRNEVGHLTPDPMSEVVKEQTRETRSKV
jgi:broad specificity phosphatase PhoE